MRVEMPLERLRITISNVVRQRRYVIFYWRRGNMLKCADGMRQMLPSIILLYACISEPCRAALIELDQATVRPHCTTNFNICFH